MADDYPGVAAAGRWDGGGGEDARIGGGVDWVLNIIIILAERRRDSFPGVLCWQERIPARAGRYSRQKPLAPWNRLSYNPVGVSER